MQAVENIRAKIKRRFSHKDPNPNFDEYESGDEETSAYLQREIDDAEKTDEPQGKQGSLLNRLISHGNKKTEEEIARGSVQTQETAGTSAGQSSEVTTGR